MQPSDKRPLMVAALLVEVASGLYWPFVTIDLVWMGSGLAPIYVADATMAVGYITSRIWGALSDFYGTRKRFIVAGLALSSALLLLLPLATVPAAIVALTLSVSLAYAIASPGLIAAVTAGPGGSGSLGPYFSVMALGFTVGASIIGPVHGLAGRLGVYGLASLFVLAALAVVLVAYREEARGGEEGSPWERVRRSLSLDFNLGPGFPALVAASALAYAGTEMMGPPARVKLYTLFGVGYYGVIFGLGAGLISVPAALAAGRALRRVGGFAMLASACAAYAVCAVTLALSWDPALYTVAFIAPIWILLMVGRYAAAADVTGDRERGEAVGALDSVSNAAVVATALFGPVADAVGIDATLLLSVVPFLAALAVLAPTLRAGRHRTLSLGSGAPLPRVYDN